MGFVANFVRFSAVQNFWKSAKIRQRYRQFKGGNFFWDTVYMELPPWFISLFIWFIWLYSATP